jgi:hypothetical protein
MRTAALLLILTTVVACDGEASKPKPVPSESPTASASPSPSQEKDGEVAAPEGFIATPVRALRHCPERPPLDGDCPVIVPEPSDHLLVESFGKPGGRFQVLEMSAGAPRKDPAANAPPAFVHVVIEAGDARHLIDFGEATGTESLEDSLLEQKRDLPVGLGTRTWGGVTGDLILAPSFPGGGAHGDHLVFRWRRGGVIHNVSLHAWTPIAETESALKRMVASIP